MNKLSIAIATILLTCAAAGQEVKSSATQGVDQALQQRFREYADALTKRDIATLDKIWAADYVFINPQGEVVTKAQRIANVKSGATEFKGVNPESERIRVQGDVAIDVGRVTLEGTKYSGKESSGDYRYMNVWRKTGDQWQLLANQITLIKK